MVTNFRKILFLALAFLLCTSANAADRDSTEMLSVANNFFNHASAKGSSRVSASAGTGITKKFATDMLNVYESSAKRFVIVAKDDRFKAVIGYSDGTSFPDTLPEGLKWWIARADSSMKSQVASGTTPTSATDILGTLTLTGSVAASVSPFVTTKWYQVGAYNLLTPTINGTNAPTGCVATAMAQCLKYVGYPATSRGTGSYSVSVVDNQNDTTTTDHTYKFGQYNYDWSSMADTYTDPSYTSADASALAVSQLMMDCGAASKMNYMSDGSGANIDDAGRGLFEYLQCDSNSVRLYFRALYPDSVWTSMVYEELNAGYPLIYCGVDAGNQSGHAFVFDGYDANGNVHVNWGWSGVADGYYDMSILHPDLTDYNYKFSSNQMMLTGIRTTSNLRSYQSQWLVFDNLSVRKSMGGNSISYTIGGACNFGLMDFRGLISLVARSSSGTYTALSTVSTGSENVPMYYGLSDYTSQMPVSTSALSNGTYTLMLATKGYSGNGTLESAYQPMIGYTDVTSTYTLVKTSGGITLTANAATSTTGIEAVQTSGTDTTTTRVYNMQGQLIYSAPTSTFSVDDIPAGNGVVIIKQGSSVTKRLMHN